MLAIALAWAITATMHYRVDVTSLRREPRAARLPAPATVASPIILSVSTAALPASGTLRGSIMAITAISARSLKTVLVTAQIVGARPNSRYELLGGDCVGSATTRTWASGVTNADGSAQLAGPSMTISSSRHEYYFSLDLRGRLSSPGPAAHGYLGSLTAFPPSGQTLHRVPHDQTKLPGWAHIHDHFAGVTRRHLGN